MDRTTGELAVHVCFCVPGLFSTDRQPGLAPGMALYPPPRRGQSASLLTLLLKAVFSLVFLLWGLSYQRETIFAFAKIARRVYALFLLNAMEKKVPTFVNPALRKPFAALVEL
jgi:hypothetical protein